MQTYWHSLARCLINELETTKSTVYHYLHICTDEHYAGHIDAFSVIRHIEATEMLQAKSPFQFEFSADNDWFLISLLNCDSHGNYSSDGQLCDQINLIEIIFEIDSEKALEFARTLAEQLGWRMIDVTNT